MLWIWINRCINLISLKPDVNKICLYAKDAYEAQYQLLINKQKSLRSQHCTDPKAFIEYSNGINDMKILINTIPIY